MTLQGSVLANLGGSEMSLLYRETWEVSGFEPRMVGILGLKELMMANFRQLNFKREEMRVSLQCDPGEGGGASSSREMRVSLQCDPGEHGEHPLVGSPARRERL